ncbi:TPA: hypothetical protein ACIRVE_005373 [Pseudomonas putida]
MASPNKSAAILPPGMRRSFNTSKTLAALMSAAAQAEQAGQWAQASEYFDAAAAVCQEPKEYDRLVLRAGLCRDKLSHGYPDSELQ